MIRDPKIEQNISSFDRDRYEFQQSPGQAKTKSFLDGKIKASSVSINRLIFYPKNILHGLSQNFQEYFA